MLTRLSLGAVAALALLTVARPAQAQYRAHPFYARQPGYTFELEPHLVAGLANPPGPGVDQGGGAGLRGSFVISRDGFIPTANDSLAIGFGIDALHYRGGYGDYFGTCVSRTPGPAGTSICTDVDTPGGPRNYIFVPLVLQWNFWLTDRWSAFVEPGIDLYFTAHHGGVTPALGIGGRRGGADLPPRLADGDDRHLVLAMSRCYDAAASASYARAAMTLGRAAMRAK